MNALLEKEDTLRYVDIADAMMVEYNMPWFSRRDIQQRLRKHFRESYMAGVYIGILTAICSRGYAALFRQLRNAWFIICDDVVLGDCLVAALQHDHLELADALVADPDTDSRNGFTVAVMRGHLDIAERIYRVSSNDPSTDFHMREVMTAAIAANDIRSVRYVFEKYPYIHDEHFAAAAQGAHRWDVLQFLLAQEDAVPTDTALAAAISTNNVRAVEAIWQHENFTDYNTRPWLVMAAKHVYVYTWLWKRANIERPERLLAMLFYLSTPETTVFTLRNMRDDEWTQRGLMKELSPTHGKPEVLKVIVSDPRFVVDPKYLLIATRVNAVEVMRVLIPSAGSGYTEAAEMAIKYGNALIVDMLMHYVRDRVLLIQAVYSRNYTIVKTVLKEQKSMITSLHMFNGLLASIYDGDDADMFSLLLKHASEKTILKHADVLIGYMNTLDRGDTLEVFLKHRSVDVSYEEALDYLHNIVDPGTSVWFTWRSYVRETDPILN